MGWGSKRDERFEGEMEGETREVFVWVGEGSVLWLMDDGFGEVLSVVY